MSNNIGGQAVIEGVMMRDKTHYSVAVRLENGTIITDLQKIKKWHKFFDLPFIRGIKALYENLTIGYKTLDWSAKCFEKEKKESSIISFISLIISLIFGIGLFIVLPNLVVHYLLGLVEEKTPILYNILAGIVRLLVFFIYVVIISFFKDVKRIFQYHGAEHKVIHTYERNEKLIYDNIKKYPTLHKRCGTSFIFLLIFISIIIFSIVPPVLSQIFPDFNSYSLFLKKILILSSHIILIPLLGSISYELLKVSAKENLTSKILSILSYPGLFFQKITTKEPDEKQVEVAVKALEVLINKNNS
ncbi:MAG TPA: DUF1385 domain-containing protein [Spirochaetota bacterium]|nr:DUF1385 domain-containing protein [Spirochaetota bacterium]HOM38111.1 DUF1385 domain-containing protein [Spirochaetota bacterium]HPQ48913.1 DUF1385 domain-containing protein [Spirochaetota bacterium]